MLEELPRKRTVLAYALRLRHPDYTVLRQLVLPTKAYTALLLVIFGEVVERYCQLPDLFEK